MRTHGTLRPFPHLTQIARLSSAPSRWTDDHLTAVLADDPIERNRALLSVLLDAEEPSWVRVSTSTPDPLHRHGGRRHMTLSWTAELDLVADLEANAKAGERVTTAVIAQLMSERAGQPASLLAAYRLLHRHGWILTRRTPRGVRS